MAILATNPLRETTLTVVDSLGRTVRVVDGNGNITTTSFDVVTNGLVETMQIDALGHAWRSRQDSLGRERERVDPEGQLMTTVLFDAAGNRRRVRDADGVGEDCLVFDARNRCTSYQDTKGNTRRTRYDVHSNQIALVDGLLATTTNVFDARDRRIRSTDRLGGITLYTYDANSNLVQMVDAERNVTVYEYDARNLRVRETFPSSGNKPNIRMTSFDPGRRLALRTDQAGDKVEYNYDHANRLTRRRYPDRLDDVFAYDQASRLIDARSKRYQTVVQRQYDHGGRLTGEQQRVLGEDHVLSYTYDRANRQTQVQYGNRQERDDDNRHDDRSNRQTQIERTFTARNQLETVLLDGSRIASRVYTPGMRLRDTTLGNGLVDHRKYEGNGLLSDLEVAHVTTFAYNYDANNWKTQEHVITSPGESQDFHYDAEGRLISWARDNAQTQTWNLSIVGDWEQTQRDGAVEARTHNAVHALTSLNRKALSYDPKGNLVRDDETNRYDWDFENRLRQARDGDGKDEDDDREKSAEKDDEDNGRDDGKHDGKDNKVAYFYDALGRRLGKATKKTTTVFVHDGEQVVAEYENRRLARRYVFGSYVDEPLALSTEEGLFFYTANRQYSVAALTDSHGRVIERYRYDAYGSRTVTDAGGGVKPESSVKNQIGFTGRYHDPDSALIDFRSRQYDPRLGRFIGRDQSYVDGMSLYAAYFVPNQTDPSGAKGLCTITRVMKPSLKVNSSEPLCGPSNMPSLNRILYRATEEFAGSRQADRVQSCCAAHDECYDRGGVSESDRKHCDVVFDNCILNTTANEDLARLFHGGVRLFGSFRFDYLVPSGPSGAEGASGSSSGSGGAGGSVGGGYTSDSDTREPKPNPKTCINLEAEAAGECGGGQYVIGKCSVDKGKASIVYTCDTCEKKYDECASGCENGVESRNHQDCSCICKPEKDD